MIANMTIFIKSLKDVETKRDGEPLFLVGYFVADDRSQSIKHIGLLLCLLFLQAACFYMRLEVQNP